jgi:hypothetical protein
MNSEPVCEVCGEPAVVERVELKSTAPCKQQGVLWATYKAGRVHCFCAEHDAPLPESNLDAPQVEERS